MKSTHTFSDPNWAADLRRAPIYPEEIKRYNGIPYLSRQWALESLFVGPKSVYVELSLGLLTEADVNEIRLFSSRERTSRRYAAKATGRNSKVWCYLGIPEITMPLIERMASVEEKMKFRTPEAFVSYFQEVGELNEEQSRQLLEFYQYHYYEG